MLAGSPEAGQPGRGIGPGRRSRAIDEHLVTSGHFVIPKVGDAARNILLAEETGDVRIGRYERIAAALLDHHDWRTLRGQLFERLPAGPVPDEDTVLRTSGPGEVGGSLHQGLLGLPVVVHVGDVDARRAGHRRAASGP